MSAETERYTHRNDLLRQTGAGVKCLSIASLPRLSLDGIDWVIAGGESGPGAADA